MQIERVDCTPSKDVYHPGEVINIAVYFRKPFVGQCEVGLVHKEHAFASDFRRTTFARSSNNLYEGQLYIRDSQVGRCILLARLAPVTGTAQVVAAGDRIIEVRSLRP
jgi:hypothetical protein